MMIATSRLILRKMNTDDYDALYAVLADSDTMQHYPYSFDEKRVRGWIDRNIERYRIFGFGLWAVCLKESGVGNVKKRRTGLKQFTFGFNIILFDKGGREHRYRCSRLCHSLFCCSDCCCAFHSAYFPLPFLALKKRLYLREQVTGQGGVGSKVFRRQKRTACSCSAACSQISARNL